MEAVIRKLYGPPKIIQGKSPETKSCAGRKTADKVSNLRSPVDDGISRRIDARCFLWILHLKRPCLRYRIIFQKYILVAIKLYCWCDCIRLLYPCVATHTINNYFRTYICEIDSN